MKWKKSLLIFIILLSLFLRVYGLEYSIFDHETVKPILKSQEILNGDFYLGGFDGFQSFGPFLYYLLVVPLFFSSNIIFIYGFLAIFNVFAILVSYFFVKRFFNEEIALISSLLFAVSPWHVFYSRFLWNPNFLSFFVILFFYFVFSYYFERKRLSFLLSVFFFMVLLNFHLSALAFSPILFLLFYKTKSNFKQFFSGLLIVFLCLIPLFVFSGINAPFKIVSYSTLQDETPLFTNFIEAFGIPIILSSNYFGDYVFGSLSVPFLFNLILYIGTFISLFILLLTLFYFLRNYDKNNLILLLWLILPILFLLVRGQNIAPHYYIILFPVIFIYEAIFLSSIIKRRFFSYLFIFFLILLFFSNLILIYLVALSGGTDGAYGITYQNKKEAIDYVINKNADLIFIGEIPLEYHYILHNINSSFSISVLKNVDEISNLSGYIILDDYSSVGKNSLKEYRSLVGDIKNNYAPIIIKRIKLFKV